MQQITTHEAPVLSQDAQFALDYSRSLDPTAPPDVKAAEEHEVLSLTHTLDNVEEQLLVLNSLYARASDREAAARAIEAGEDLKYGDGLIEVGSLDEARKVSRRILIGKNPAMIIRSDVWGDKHAAAGEEIRELFADSGEFDQVGVQKFPRPSMTKGSSGLHLDNFIRDREGKSGFRYAFSAAQLERGKMLFMAGIASKRSRDTGPKQEGVAHPYEDALLRLEADPRVKQQYSSAETGRPKSHTEFTTTEGKRMIAVVMNPDDLVIWPQGGPGSEAPAWHAFRRIGNEERPSTSYHFVQHPAS